MLGKIKTLNTEVKRSISLLFLHFQLTFINNQRKLFKLLLLKLSFQRFCRVKYQILKLRANTSPILFAYGKDGVYTPLEHRGKLFSLRPVNHSTSLVLQQRLLNLNLSHPSKWSRSSLQLPFVLYPSADGGRVGWLTIIELVSLYTYWWDDDGTSIKVSSWIHFVPLSQCPVGTVFLTKMLLAFKKASDLCEVNHQKPWKRVIIGKIFFSVRHNGPHSPISS